MTALTPIDGLLAEFSDVQTLVAAARSVRDAGYRRTDAFSPFPIEELTEALGIRRTRLPWLVLVGGVLGGIGGYALQVWSATSAYPLNVGGRPLHSWPAFVPVTFELTILIAALSAVLGMLALNGLPRPHHPLFGVPRFEHATRDRFYLCIEAADPRFDRDQTRAFLAGLSPTVDEVPY